MVIYTDTLLHYSPETTILGVFSLSLTKNINFLDLLSALYHGKFRRFARINIHATFAIGVASDSQYVRVEKSDYFH